MEKKKESKRLARARVTCIPCYFEVYPQFQVSTSISFFPLFLRKCQCVQLLLYVYREGIGTSSQPRFRNVLTSTRFEAQHSLYNIN